MSTIVTDIQRRPLEHHVLDRVAKAEGVEVWTMRRPNDSAYRVQVTFTREGICIQGDISLGEGGHGICSAIGYAQGWFTGYGKLSEDDLLSKFMEKRWCPSTVQAELDAHAKQAAEDAKPDDEGNTDELEVKQAAAWATLAEEWNEDEYGVHWLHERAGDLGITDFWDYGIGHTYDPTVAPWLVAIQQRFAELYAEIGARPCPSCGAASGKLCINRNDHNKTIAGYHDSRIHPPVGG